jgi:hypothetical protein
MKIKDVERINGLLKSREEVSELIARVARAEPADCQLMIERGGDGSIKLSEEGADSTHFQGYPVSVAFLGRLKALALEELGARRAGIEGDLAAMGVETEE